MNIATLSMGPAPTRAPAPRGGRTNRALCAADWLMPRLAASRPVLEHIVAAYEHSEARGNAAVDDEALRCLLSACPPGTLQRDAVYEIALAARGLRVHDHRSRCTTGPANLVHTDAIRPFATALRAGALARVLDMSRDALDELAYALGGPLQSYRNTAVLHSTEGVVSVAVDPNVSVSFDRRRLLHGANGGGTQVHLGAHAHQIMTTWGWCDGRWTLLAFEPN